VLLAIAHLRKNRASFTRCKLSVCWADALSRAKARKKDLFNHATTKQLHDLVFYSIIEYEQRRETD
jgi:hypothetical protein